jgi:hypothetical protein
MASNKQQTPNRKYNSVIQWKQSSNRLLASTPICATVMLLLGLNLFIIEVVGQLTDNGVRNSGYNFNYNSNSGGDSVQGTQTILEVVKSINYLSEVRTHFTVFIFLIIHIW